MLVKTFSQFYVQRSANDQFSLCHVNPQYKLRQKRMFTFSQLNVVIYNTKFCSFRFPQKSPLRLQLHKPVHKFLRKRRENDVFEKEITVFNRAFMELGQGITDHCDLTWLKFRLNKVAVQLNQLHYLQVRHKLSRYRITLQVLGYNDS